MVLFTSMGIFEAGFSSYMSVSVPYWNRLDGVLDKRI